jgi:MoaA/NifB/PqqE/SkfB family radical SAM enzyme
MEGSAALFEDRAFSVLSWGARSLARHPRLRDAALRAAERRLHADADRPAEELRHPQAVQQDKLAIGLALLRLAERALVEDRLSRAAWRGLLERLIRDALLKRGDAAAKARFRATHGSSPPDFLTISPGKACNLRCVGCYANAGANPEKLDFSTFERIVNEARDRWGTRFFVISGGEPLAYRSEGKGLLEMAERHPDCFFMFYTNGTLITDAVAARLSELGNLSPALSTEGLRDRTDARRGAGVFDKVLAAMERLRGAKVLYGLSLTATRENADEILSDEVVDFFFGEMGVLYAWMFHYMPIGRSFTLDLMATPQQRLRLFERVWSLVRERRLPIADFWNSGTATNGCVAGGRPGGYLYVDWNGNVNPCVFVPYSPTNIKDVYARGGTLDDVWREPFFAGIRAWQRDYGYRESGERSSDCGNWMMPCLIRDHHDVFLRLVREHRPRPSDPDAQAALDDPAYHAGLHRFDEELHALTDPVWEARYSPRPAATRG